MSTSRRASGTPESDDVRPDARIEADYERMKAAGAEFKMPPTKVTGSTIAQVDDNSGNLIQITQLNR